MIKLQQLVKFKNSYIKSTNSFCLVSGCWMISGHSAVNIAKSKIVIFGGVVDKRFLNDITVYDAGTFSLSLLSRYFCVREIVLVGYWNYSFFGKFDMGNLFGVTNNIKFEFMLLQIYKMVRRLILWLL